MRPTIATLLAHRRRTLRLNQTRAGDQIGIVQPLYSMYERGQRVPSVANFRRIATWLGLSMDELYEQTKGQFTERWR